MSAQHTPGPWSWDAGVIPPDGPGRYADIYVTDEDLEPIIIAEFNDNIPQGRANARLIAAAPDLLAAVLFLLPRVSAHKPNCSLSEVPVCDCGDWNERWAAARATVFNATGAS